MKTEKLFKLLALVEYVEIKTWNAVLDLVECIKTNKEVKIIDKEWSDNFKSKYPEYYPLALDEIKTWSTYDRTCIKLTFSLKEDKLFCNAKIYDGDNLSGYRGNIRFEAELILPDEFIHKIENNIIWEFDDYAKQKYENHLETQKNIWINNLKAEILK